MRETLNNLAGLIGEEIELYANLSDLYENKRQALVSNDTDGLLVVDDKILEVVEAIKSSVNLRRSISKNIGSSEMGLSEMIKLASEVDARLTDELRQHQEKVNSLIEKIAYQERVIRELLRHGLTMVSKTLQVITNTSSISGDYTRMGKSTSGLLSQMSSVVTEV